MGLSSASIIYYTVWVVLLVSKLCMGRSRGGGQGVRTPPPPEKSQKYRVSCNTGPDPLKNHKATKSYHLNGVSLGGGGGGGGQ